MEYAEKGVVMDIAPHSITEPLSDTQCRNVFKQLTKAVDHIHQSGIIHRGKTIINKLYFITLNNNY